MTRSFPMFVGGRARLGGKRDVIKSPYDGAAVSEVSVAERSDMEDALASAHAARDAMRALPAHERIRVLEALAGAVRIRADEIAELITCESGKPIRYARAEVVRATTTLSLGAHTAATLGGEVLPADIAKAGEHKLLLYKRVPRGVVGAIGPFNFPLNLLAHKVSPALAVGAPIVIKPPHQAPGAGLLARRDRARARLARRRRERAACSCRRRGASRSRSARSRCSRSREAIASASS